MFILKYILINILFFNLLYNNTKDTSTFRPPVKIPVFLSSNFGELRIDHFHSGIDIKTQGVTGKEVVAAAGGYIYRISVSPGGFGKALYLRHPSGYSTVYAHLDRFTPEIEEYVREQQYERKSFLVTLFPPKEMFPVNPGTLIAYSGNSGSSFGPHLHFEVRKTENEFPVNPLLFDFGASDKLAPVIEKIEVYPIGKNSFINDENRHLRINAKGSNGKYSLATEREVVISGNAGFGIKLHDLMDGSSNKCEAYSIELQVDSSTTYKYVMDGFGFNESRYVNSHIDYPAYIKERIYIHRAFVLPNDRLGAYSNLVNRGIFNFNDNKIHKVRIIVCDADNNRSVISFRVRSQAEKPALTSAPADTKLVMMPFNKSNKFTSENVSVNIPSGALYDTLYFSFRKRPGTPVMYSGLYSINNNLTPVQKPFTLAIRPDNIPAGKESRMLIVQLNENMSKTPTRSTWSDGYLKADVLAFGDYFVGIDTVAPIILANGLTSGANLQGKKEIKIRITDDFSGIKSYDTSIDGKWALFEYDQKNDILIYHFDEKYITRGTTHNLSLKVSDNKDNENRFSCDFIW